MAKPGIPIVLFFGAITVLCALIARFLDASGLRYAAVFFAVFTVFTIYFFRDPERVVPEGKDQFVSPADGRVLRIIRVPEGVRVDVFMSLFNVHVNRIPCSGRVERITYYPGRFSRRFRIRPPMRMNAWKP